MGVLIFLLVVGGLIAFLWHIAVKQNAAMMEARAERAKLYSVAVAARTEFLNGQVAWSEPTSCTLTRADGWLFSDDTELRVVTYNMKREFEIATDDRYPIAGLSSASLEREERVERFKRTVVTPIAVQKGKSPIARGAVGGLLLGPAGLVLGAASGLTTKTKIVEHVHEVDDQRIVIGKPTLVLKFGTPLSHIVKLEMPSDLDVERWVSRLQTR
jgi:hypothetical protein